MALNKEFIEQLKAKNDIVDVISGYCQLERRGGAFWARCPLPGHVEKTPSFCVNQAGQFFKCFGCGRGGDVIKFIMEVENLNYVEAVKLLAERAGLEMPENLSFDENKSAEQRKVKERRLSILLETAKFYLRNLYSPAGKPYLDYMQNRGFSVKTMRTFGLGASTSYRALPEYLKGLGYTYEEMLSCGVVSFNKDKNEYTDFEAERLIVPIIDNVGNVIAFGGRIIVKKDFAKYKNTRETDIFVKNRCLFNINNLKNLRRKVGEIPYVIMVEGYMDVIALFEAGFENVVASMGTSLTVEQARLLQRYTDTVVISYDGDAAGQHATFRGLQILKDAGLNVKVVALPDNLDPDEFVKLKGAEAYKKIVEDALPLIDYKLKVLEDRFDTASVDGKRKYVENALRVISESDKDFEREELLKKVSQKSRITFESLKRDLEKVKTGEKPTYSATSSETLTPTSALEKAERFILYSTIFNEPYADANIDEMEFSSPERAKIASFLADEKAEMGRCEPSSVYDALGDEYLDELNAVLLLGDGLEKEAFMRYYRDSVRTVKIRSLEGEINDLKEYFNNLTDLDERTTILGMIQKKINELNKLKTEDKK